MKNIKKIIGSALLATAFAATSVGTTFALFTDEAKTTITVGSGIVNIENSISLVEYRSSVDGTVEDLTGETSYSNELVGNNFSLSGSIVNIEKMVPGDKLTVKLSALNKSNVRTKTRYVVSHATVGTKADLFPALKFTFNAGSISAADLFKWQSNSAVAELQMAEGVALYGEDGLLVAIELPDSHNGALTFGSENLDNQYQDKACSISFDLQAVQGNATVNPIDEINAYLTYQAMTSEGQNKTMYGAVVDMREIGYGLENLNVLDGYVYDLANDQFVTEASAGSNKLGHFKVYSSMPEEQTFSIYAIGDGWTTINPLTVGFDAGETTSITSINYDRSTAENGQEVTIRTNTAQTALTINAPLDTIHHYDALGSLNIIEAATASYHENGKVAYAEVAKGRIVLEKGSDVDQIHINKKTNASFDTVIIANNGGAAELPEKITRDAVTVSEETLVVKVESNGSSENVYVYADGDTGTKGSTEKVTEGENKQNENVESALGQLVLDNGGQAGEKAQSVEEKETAKEEAVDAAIIVEIEEDDSKYVARIGKVGYESLKDALTAAANGDVVELLKNDDSTEQLNLSKPIVLNMNGKTYAGNLRLAYDGVTVNGTANVINVGASLTIDSSTIYYGQFVSGWNKANSLLNDGTISAHELPNRVVLKLFTDLTMSGPYNTNTPAINFDIPMTLDLNGHTFEYGRLGYAFIMKDNFVLKDSSAGKNGVLYASRATSAAILIGTNAQSASFTLESGTIQSECEIFDTYSNCSVDVKGGHLISFSKYGAGDSRGIFKELSSGCTFTMSGGEFRSDQSARSFDGMSFDPLKYPNNPISTNATVSITGGVFSGQAIQKYVPGYVSDQTFTNQNPTIIVGNYQITRSTISSPYGAVPYDVYLYTIEAASNN